jgi:hypothetical protein
MVGLRRAAGGGGAGTEQDAGVARLYSRRIKTSYAEPRLTPLHLLYFQYVVPLILGLVGIGFVTIALKTLLVKRPVVFPAPWLFVLLLLSILPTLALSVYVALTAPQFSATSLLSGFIWLALLAFIRVQMRGHLVIGATPEYLHDALVAAAAQHGQTIEQMAGTLRICETGEEVRVAIQRWMGYAQISASGRTSPQFINRLAVDLRAYFANHSGPMRHTSGVAYLLAGVLTLLFSVYVSATATTLAANQPAAHSDTKR